MQGKIEKSKGKLTIVIPQSDRKIQRQPQQQDQIYVKPIYSMKNSRKPAIKFKFDEEKLQTVREIKSKKLQKQKDILLSSLGALKFGAISAIAQKQQQIDQLKSQLGWDEVKQMQQQIESLLQQRKQLKEEIQELEQKLLFERQSYMRLLEQKDRVIEELYVELGSSQIQIEKLQKFEEMKQKKIKIIQQQNNCLFHQLQEEKLAQLKQIYEVGQKHTYIPTFEQNTQQTVNKFDHAEKQPCYDSVDLQEIEARHKNELSQLTAFYEKRMSEMRQIYQKQLALWPIQQSKENSLNNQLLEEVASLRHTNIPIPNRLSSEINAKRLSDCYSLTRKDPSKIDKQSLQISQKDHFDDFRFFKRVNKTPASQTTSSLKVNDGIKAIMTEIKNRNETQMSDDKKSDNIYEKQQKQKISLSSFLYGAIAGGAMTFLVNNFLRR